MLPLLALIVTTTFTPARPTVGDPITVNFPAPAVVQPSPDYEIVSQRGRSAVVRTFEPKTFTLHTTAGEVMIPVHSVLAPNDKMQPAPLAPPRKEPYPRAPFVAIAIAALAAIAAWTAAALLARGRVVKPAVVLDPADEFRAVLRALPNGGWAQLADATRRYLAATDPNLGMELTTRELLARHHDATVAEVLRQGDLQKFSPWGAAPGDVHALAQRALMLIPEPVQEEAA